MQGVALNGGDEAHQAGIEAFLRVLLTCPTVAQCWQTAGKVAKKDKVVQDSVGNIGTESLVDILAPSMLLASKPMPPPPSLVDKDGGGLPAQPHTKTPVVTDQSPASTNARLSESQSLRHEERPGTQPDAPTPASLGQPDRQAQLHRQSPSEPLQTPQSKTLPEAVQTDLVPRADGASQARPAGTPKHDGESLPSDRPKTFSAAKQKLLASKDPPPTPSVAVAAENIVKLAGSKRDHEVQSDSSDSETSDGDSVRPLGTEDEGHAPDDDTCVICNEPSTIHRCACGKPVHNGCQTTVVGQQPQDSEDPLFCRYCAGQLLSRWLRFSRRCREKKQRIDKRAFCEREGAPRSVVEWLSEHRQMFKKRTA